VPKPLPTVVGAIVVFLAAASALAAASHPGDRADKNARSGVSTPVGSVTHARSTARTRSVAVLAPRRKAGWKLRTRGARVRTVAVKGRGTISIRHKRSRVGSATFTRPLGEVRQVRVRATLRVPRMGLRPGQRRSLIGVGTGDHAVRFGVVRLADGRRAWALWRASRADGASAPTIVRTRFRTRWVRVRLMTQWDSPTSDAVVTVGRRTERLPALDLSGHPAKNVQIGLGRAPRRAGKATVLLRRAAVIAYPTSNKSRPAPIKPGPPATPALWSEDFEDGWQTAGSNVFHNEQVALVDSGGVHNNARNLQITHPPGTFYGMEWSPKFTGLGLGSMEDVYFRYYLKPWQDYYFRLEAKIPGLGGGNLPTGCDAPDPSQGWSGRLQWGQVDNHTKGRIQTYLYVGSPGSNTGCGFKEFWAAGADLTPGAWSCIEMRYKMNTPGQPDGIMQGWFNGQLKYDRRDILFRSQGSLATDTLMGVFYHGGQSEWQPLKTEYMYMDSLAISNAPIGC
jgi:hypothetical protein